MGKSKISRAEGRRDALLKCEKANSVGQKGAEGRRNALLKCEKANSVGQKGAEGRRNTLLKCEKANLVGTKGGVSPYRKRKKRSLLGRYKI